MRKVLRFALRLLGVGRPEPRTRAARVLRRCERGVTVVGLLYIGLHVFPQPLYGYQVSAGGLTLHAREAVGEEAKSCLARAAKRLRGSELFVEGLEGEVFVCGSRPWYALFAPARGGSFAISVPVTDHCFIASADFAEDRVDRLREGNSTRSLSGVIAHEMTHVLIRKRLGIWGSRRLPHWVAEGYCDYVAGEGSFPEEAGMRIFLAGESDPSPSYKYFEARMLVTYVLEGTGASFADLVARGREHEAVKAEARAWFAGRSSER